MTMLTRILASSVRIIPWTLGSPFLSFLITGGGGGGGGFCALAMGLQRYIKATKKDTIFNIYIYIYIYIYMYVYVGPYEIRFNFSQIPFYFFLNSFFSVSIFF